jgi:YHYH protein
MFGRHPSLSSLWLTVALAFAGSCDTASDGVVMVGAGTSTAGVACDYTHEALNSSPSVNLVSSATWRCDSTSRTLTANGVPDHEVGTFPNANNPNSISAQTVTATLTLSPQVVSATGESAMVVGYALNGVKFDPGTGGTCDDSGDNCSLVGGTGSWRIEALGQRSFNFGTDDNHAHVQPDGAYHYHGLPEALLSNLRGDSAAMTLIGWAGDGFPVYARYGYVVADDASSGVHELVGSYHVKSAANAGRPSTDIYPMGAFVQDYEYVAGSGDLDECNGRVGVTPEFPSGTYYYMATDSYPFLPRCLKGTSSLRASPPPRLTGAGAPGLRSTPRAPLSAASFVARPL